MQTVSKVSTKLPEHFLFKKSGLCNIRTFCTADYRRTPLVKGENLGKPNLIIMDTVDQAIIVRVHVL